MKSFNQIEKYYSALMSSIFHHGSHERQLSQKEEKWVFLEDIRSQGKVMLNWTQRGSTLKLKWMGLKDA